MIHANHYDTADRLDHRAIDGDGLTDGGRDRLLASAQVHATLALADTVRNLTEVLVERM